MRLRSALLILVLVSALPAVVLFGVMGSNRTAPTGTDHWQTFVIPPLIFVAVLVVGPILRRHRRAS